MPSDYNRFLLEARRSYASNATLTLKQLEKAYASLVGKLVTVLRSAPPGIDRARAAMMIQSAQRILGEYGIGVEKIITAGVKQSITKALTGHNAAIKALETGVGRSFGHSFARVPRDVFEALLTKRQFARTQGLRGFSELFRSAHGAHLRTAAAGIDEAIINGVGAGLDSSEIADDIARLMSPPSQRDLISQVGVADDVAQTATKLGVNQTTVRSVQATLRKAELIAIHEMNTAYHEADAMATRRSPVIKHVRWRLSGRHDSVHSSPDVCDALAGADVYGKGAGVYPVDAVPALPHPRCLCTTEKVLLEPRDWGNDKARFFVRDAKSRKLTPNYVAQFMEGKTDNAIGRAADTFTRVVADSKAAATPAARKAILAAGSKKPTAPIPAPALPLGPGAKPKPKRVRTEAQKERRRQRRREKREAERAAREGEGGMGPHEARRRMASYTDELERESGYIWRNEFYDPATTRAGHGQPFGAPDSEWVRFASKMHADLDRAADRLHWRKREALGEYKFDSELLNRWLRNPAAAKRYYRREEGHFFDEADWREMVKDMRDQRKVIDSSFKTGAYVTERPIKVVRKTKSRSMAREVSPTGDKPDQAIADAFMRKLKGGILKDDSYLSTASARDFRWPGDVRIEMTIPKGTPTHLLDAIDEMNEMELLFDRALKWYVYSVEKKGKEWMVKCTLLTDDLDKLRRIANG